MRAIVLGLLLPLGFAGCTARFPEGRFACTTDAECPTGFGCYGGLCYSRDPMIDAGSLTDAPPIDSAGIDAPIACVGDLMTCPSGMTCFSGRCLTSDVCPVTRCVNIRVVHAGHGLPSPLPPFTMGGVPAPRLAYGRTSPVILVPVDPSGTTVTVVVDLSALGAGHMTMMFPVTTDPSFTVIISGDSLPHFTVSVLPETHNAHALATTIEYVSVVDGAPTLSVTAPTPSTVVTVSGTAMASAETTLTDADTVPIQLTSTGATPTLLAGFAATPDVLPRMNGSFYFVVFAGRTDRHLGAADGLRMIPAVANATMSPVSSGPIAWMLNGTDAPLDLCRAFMPIGGIPEVPSGALSAPFMGFDAAGPRRLFVLVNDSTCRTSTTTSVVIPPGPGRVLIGAFGSTAPPTWGVGATMEPAPADATVAQTITLANVTPFVADFGTWDPAGGGTYVQFGGATVPASMSLVDRVSGSLPTNLAFHTVGGASPPGHHEFMWPLTAPVAWAAFSYVASTAPSGFDSTAWAVSSPFGQPWTAVFVRPATHEHP